jgi:hypothetical protein
MDLTVGYFYESTAPLAEKNARHHVLRSSVDV